MKQLALLVASEHAQRFFADLRAVIQRCLVRDPGERFPSTEQLREAIGVARRYFPPVSPSDLREWVCRSLIAAQ